MTPNISSIQERAREEFVKGFTDLYGLEDPTNTFSDHDDFLIIRDNFNSFLDQAILQAIHSFIEATEVEIVVAEYTDFEDKPVSEELAVDCKTCGASLYDSSCVCAVRNETISEIKAKQLAFLEGNK